MPELQFDVLRESFKMISVEAFAQASAVFQAAFWKREAMRYQLDRWSLSDAADLIASCQKAYDEAQAALMVEWAREFPDA